MDALTYRVSTVNSGYGSPARRVGGTISVEELAGLIRGDPGIREQTERVREARNQSGKAYAAAKRGCRSVMPAVCAPEGTLRRNMPLDHPSGLYPIDIDQDVGDPRRADGIIEALKGVPHCVLAARSVGGRDAWALLAGPKAYDWDQYRQLHLAMVETLPESIRRHTAPKGQRDPTRLRYLGADESVYLNPDPTAANPSLRTPGEQDAEPRCGPEEWRAALEFLIARRLLGDDSTRLAVGMCMKSNGRSYPEWADACRRGGSSRPENFSKQRWESFAGADAGWSTVTGLAGKAGFTDGKRRAYDMFPGVSPAQDEPPPGQRRREAPVHGPGDAWGDYALPAQELTFNATYPVTSWVGAAGRFVHDLVDATGARPEGCALAAIGALSATFQPVYTVTGLPPSPIPLSTFAVWAADTSARKSTLFDLAFEGHRDADDELFRRWRRVQRDYERPKKGNRDSSGGNSMAGPVEEPGQAPRLKKPMLLVRDPTVEALGLRLQDGRRDLVIANDEAVVFTRNWSGSRSQRARSLAAFSKLWSGGIFDEDRTSGGGREVYVSGASLSMCLAIQEDYGLDWLLSGEAANGFSARTLIAYSEDSEPGEDAPRRNAALSALRETQARVKAFRSRLDAGMEYAETGLAHEPRRPLELDSRAHRTLRDLYGEARDAARQMPRGHVRGFFRRIPEHVTRLAALWTLWNALCERAPGELLPDSILVEGETLRRAAEVIGWHGAEIRRLDARAGMTRLTAACDDALRIAKAKASADGSVALHRELSRQGRCKNDIELRTRVIDELLRTGCIRKQRSERGNPRIFLHPDLR